MHNLTIRSIIYIAVGFALFFSIRLSETFWGKSQDGALAPVNIDQITAEHLEGRRWDSALEDLIPLFERTDDSNLKAYIAWCYREQGIEAYGEQRYDEAVALSEAGLQYATGEAGLHFVLGVAHLAKSDYEEAEEAFNEVLAIDSTRVEVYKHLGEIHYLRNEPQKAEAAWSKALGYDPEDGNLQKRLTALRKQLHLNETLDTDDNLHFSVTYDGETMPRLEHTVLNTLENAYYDIGAQLQIYPKRRISVTLLTRLEFSNVTGSPDWTAGLYEGQIKIPVAGADSERLKKTLYHEYTHAVLFDQVGSRCPWWLNEGLAQYLSDGQSGDPVTGYAVRRERSLHDGATLGALGSVFGLDEEGVAHSYSLALSGVRYFIDSFGETGMQKLILLMAEENSFDAAFRTATGYSFEQFEEDWRTNR